jgi:hypothetical protein
MLKKTGNGKFDYSKGRIPKKNDCKHDPGPTGININRTEDDARNSDKKMN